MNETQILAALAANPQLLAAVMKAADTTGNAIPPTGTNALWQIPGAQPGIASAMVQPLAGLEGFLYRAGHVRISQEDQPVQVVLTGQLASSGTENTTACAEDAPIAGDFKAARVIWPFGQMFRQSKPFNILDAGRLVNSASPIDLRLLNDPFAELPATGLSAAGGNIFRDYLAKATIETLNALHRDFRRLAYTGNPASTAGNTGYREFRGLTGLVNDGYVDALSGQAVPALDSLIRDFTSAVVQTSATTYVTELVDMVRDRLFLAEQVGLTPSDLELAFVMPTQLFYATADVWPCVFNTYACDAYVSGDVRVNLSGDAMRAERERILRERTLPVLGRMIPVIVEDGWTMSELNVGSGNFQSDVYLVPLRHPAFSDTGGQLLYFEHFNFRGPFAAQTIIDAMGAQGEYRVSPDGRFVIHFLASSGYCKQVEMMTRKRLILRTPWLAAKLENVRYQVRIHERSPQPGTSFFVNGGGTSFQAGTFTVPA